MLSVFDHGAHAPCPAPFNLAAHVLGLADALDSKIALAVVAPSGSERWSYGRLKEAVLATGGGLLEAGLKPGDRVLLRLGNSVDFPIAFLGAIAAGLVPAPSSAQLTEAEVTSLCELLKPAAILHDPAVACPDYPGARRLPLAELRAMREAPPCSFEMGDPDRLAYVVFTSGTSGSSRAVAHAHRAIWARQMMHGDWYGLTEADRVMHAGAFNWTYTLGTGLLDPWSVGATALIPEDGTATAALPLLLKRFDASIFAAVPGVYRRLLKSHAKLDLPKLRHGLSAGEKLPPSVQQDWENATGKPLLEAYGMSECSTFVSAAPGAPAAPGTLGRPQKGRRVAILGAEGPVPWGTPGEIAVARRDPGLMLGYLDAPEATEARMRGEWFLTGDQGMMDADGHITFLGRRDDMLNAGGHRVSPLEVEAALTSHPQVSEAGAAEVEVKPGVRVIAAFYTGPDPLPEDELAAHLAPKLARFKQPRLFIHCDSLPTGPNGKVLRRRLPELYEADHGQA